MQNIPIAGVYALKHRATGSVYIGSSGDLRPRLKKWRTALNGEHSLLPMRLRALTTCADDWDMSVVFDGTNSSLAQIRAAERSAIDQVAEKAPHKLLNAVHVGHADGLTYDGRTQSLRTWTAEVGVPHQTIAARLRRRWTPGQALGFDAPPAPATSGNRIRETAQAESQAYVLVFDGDRMLTQREVAEELGVSQDHIRKRLRRFRATEGQAQIQIDQLRRPAHGMVR